MALGDDLLNAIMYALCHIRNHLPLCILLQEPLQLLRLQKTVQRALIPVTLKQQAKDISKWNAPVISCAAKVQDEEQKYTCKNLCQYMYCLGI
jgi:hypothetical protein